MKAETTKDLISISSNKYNKEIYVTPDEKLMISYQPGDKYSKSTDVEESNYSQVSVNFAGKSL